MANQFTKLSNRGLLELDGVDSLKLLQGLLTNDVYLVQAQGIVYSLMLTPQGRFLYDFFVFAIDAKIYLDFEREHSLDIIKKLNLYKLRYELNITDVSEAYEVLYTSTAMVISFKDPRSETLGYRTYLRKDEVVSCELEENPALYLDTIFEHTIPEPHMDMIQEKSFPMEYEMDKYNAISFTKGCYLGQELTARTKHLGTIRKKLYKLNVDVVGAKGSDIIVDGNKIGISCSSYNKTLKVLLKIEDYENLTRDKVDIAAKITASI